MTSSEPPSNPPPSFWSRLRKGVTDIGGDFVSMVAMLWPVIAIPLIPLGLVILFFTLCKPY